MNAGTFARPKKLINSIKPDFPCLADEIAEPRPNMNIKVAAFTVIEKSINTVFLCKTHKDRSLHHTARKYE